MKIFTLTLAFLALLPVCRAQSLGINTDGSTPNERSILDIRSNNKGVLFPRLSSQQRIAMNLQTADAGMMVFDTDKSCLYIFTGSAWRPIPFASENEIYPVNYKAADGEPNDYLGSAVAIDGEFAAAGASGDQVNGNSAQGSVYIFRRVQGTWQFFQKISAPDGAANDRFGSALALSGNTLVVGAPSQSVNAVGGQGAVYLFQLIGNEWSLQQKLVQATGNINSNFGAALSLRFGKLLVGAPGMDNGSNFPSQGAAYLYRLVNNLWTQQNKFIPGDMYAYGRFGYSVTVGEKHLAVGAPQIRAGMANIAGAVYIFYSANGETGWSLQQSLTMTNPVFEDFFGQSVDIEGERLAVGVPGAFVANHNDAGLLLIYQFVNGSWNNTGHLEAGQPQTEAFLGRAVVLKGNQVMAAAPMFDYEGMLNAGAIWQYRLVTGQGYWSPQRMIADIDAQRVGLFGNALAIDKATGNYIIGSLYADNGRGLISFGSL